MTSKKTEAAVEAVEIEPIEEAVVEVDTPKAPEPVAATYVAVDGDSYASIAAKHKPAGTSTNEHAKRLFALNGGKTVTVGTVIKL